MFLFLLLVVTLRVVAVQADLTCLGWGLISPIVGLFCHFEPETFQAAENNTVAAVEEAVQSAKNLVQFDLTHNPAVVTYNFLDQTSHGGLAQGGTYLHNVSKDFGDVTIGFGKDSANQVLQIYELTYWNDVSFCLIRGAGRLVTQAKRRLGKRAGVPSTNDAVSMAQSCVSDKLKKIAHPAVFHINGTNQRVGSTISNLAVLLTPVGVEGELVADAADAANGAVDLAIPGSESTTRVVKMAGDNNAADHFANEAEAQAVADNMKDQSWVDKNCGICGVSPPPISDVVSKMRRGIGYRLDRRGNIMTSCCRAPTTISDVDLESIDTESPEDQNLVHDPTDYKQITEADLVPAPQYTMRDISVGTDVQELMKDLDDFSTGVVAWTPQLTNIASSDKLFKALRKVFTGSNKSQLYQALCIKERDGKLRMTSFSNQWIWSADPALQPLQAFVNAAVAQGKDIVAKLQDLSADDAQHLKGNVEFFYTAPSQTALTGTDPRGFHTDDGMMQFGVADVPGLVIKNSAQRTASRVPLAKNAFQLIKANFWDVDAWIQNTLQGPTWHSVFGPEMAERGRVSMVMSIYMKGSPLLL